MPGVVERTQRSFRPMRQGPVPAGVAARRKLSAIVRDLQAPHSSARNGGAIRGGGRDGVDAVQRIEEAVGRAGAGIGTCRNLDRSFMTADAIGGKRGTGNVAGEPL